jgi:hypothetical protein
LGGRLAEWRTAILGLAIGLLAIYLLTVEQIVRQRFPIRLFALLIYVSRFDISLAVVRNARRLQRWLWPAMACTPFKVLLFLIALLLAPLLLRPLVRTPLLPLDRVSLLPRVRIPRCPRVRARTWRRALPLRVPAVLLVRVPAALVVRVATGLPVVDL